MNLRISPPATDFFAYRAVVLGLFKLNIKARHEIPEFLNAKLSSSQTLINTFYRIQHRLELKYFNIFCSMQIEQLDELIDLEKVKLMT